jgi:hypothetical protein
MLNSLTWFRLTKDTKYHSAIDRRTFAQFCALSVNQPSMKTFPNLSMAISLLRLPIGSAAWR